MGYLELKHLRLLRAIAETGNMTRAAERLALSQSALSQQLKDIENKLEVALFFRTRKKMLLTPSGERLMRTADHVVDLLDEAELNLRQRAMGERGQLRVGTQCIFCFKWLPRLMGLYQRQFPNVEFEIGSSHDPAAELLHKKYDVIITGLPLNEDDYTHVPLFSDELVCIMATSHPLSSRDHVLLEDFGEMNLISHAEKEESRFYQLVLRPRGIEPRRFMTVVQPQAIVELVASGFGVGIFPLWAAKSMLASSGPLVSRPISEQGFPLTWKAVFLKNDNMPRFQREFIEMTRRMDIHAMAGDDQETGESLQGRPLPLPLATP
ncbi:MAG: LysR family transcriptional regulator [Thermodesulfobacteriota bacterium]